MTPTRSKIEWVPYSAQAHGPGPDCAGTLLLNEKIYSPQLRNHRPIVVYLPRRYHRDPWHRFPVVYMQDGQNLFDPVTSYGGVTWSAADAAESLAESGRDPIVVGIYHGGRRRIREYNPFAAWRKGRGAAYARFVAETVKPLIDASFRTLPDRQHTGIVGSSMGGLISLYTFFVHGDVFGRCGAMSPSLWVANGAMLKECATQGLVNGRIYVDNGSEEPSALRLAVLLEQMGYTAGQTLRYVVGQGDAHTESAWARRLPAALRFLLT